MSIRASGTFEITMTPEPSYETVEGPSIERFSIKKQFRGDLEGSSTVQMLSAGTDVKGSAAYVAIECVSGTLQGRPGRFVMQHSGTMTRGNGELTVSVIPDSGTADLKGLAGRMTIDIVDGKHLYTFDYTLDESRSG